MNPAVIVVPAVLAAGIVVVKLFKGHDLTGKSTGLAFKTPEELEKELAAEKARVALLTPAELAKVNDMAVVGINTADFDLSDEGTLPAGTFKAGDIIPTDRVSIGVKAAGLNIPGVPSGSILIRVTKFCTDTSVTGIVIAPPAATAVSGNVEQTFPLSTITGVATVDLTQTVGKSG